jgi:uncharacterized LabA/DUF88 family protein
MATRPATLKPKTTRISPKEDFLKVNKQDRVHVFIDATNLLGMLRTINKKIDFKLFIKFLQEHTRLVRASYFALMREDMDQRAENVIDMIEFAGFEVYRKWGREFQENGGHYRFKGSIIPEMTAAMVTAAYNDIDHVILISGDGELLAAAEAVKERQVRLTLIGLEHAMSEDLRRTCDSFIDLQSLQGSGIFFDP